MRVIHKRPQRPFVDMGTREKSQRDQHVHRTVCGVDITAAWQKQGNSVPDGRVFEYWVMKRDKHTLPPTTEICARCERLLALDDLASVSLDGDDEPERRVYTSTKPSGSVGWNSY